MCAEVSMIDSMFTPLIVGVGTFALGLVGFFMYQDSKQKEVQLVG